VVTVAGVASTRAGSGPALPDKPLIAVLPFANLSGDPEQEYFADGMVEEMITVLSRIRWLFVIARNSSFTYKGRAVDVKQVGRELGVRYVLEGSVRKIGGRVRITAQLIEALTGTHLWADRFDGSLQDIFELQDKAAISIAGVIEPTLEAAETDRTISRPTNDLTAYDLYLRALAKFPWAGKEQTHEARDLLCRAIGRDPCYGPALAWAAVCCMRLRNDGLSKDPEADGRKGAELARRALQAARDDPAVLANSALALSFLGEDIDGMIELVDRALAFNPSYARGWYISGVLHSLAGHLDLAIEYVETSLRLSPRGRIGAPYNAIGTALLLGRRFDEAIPKLLLAIQDVPGFPHTYRALAACYAHKGRLDEARNVVDRLRAITPVVVPDLLLYQNPEQRELYLSGLRLAAGETE
jgi:TolB-like protein